MAKLNKEKFSRTGVHEKDRTTYVRDIELQLYYDTARDFFYFEDQEIAKHISGYGPGNRIDFGGCRTRKHAVAMFAGFIKQSLLDGPSVRMLIVEIGFNELVLEKARNTQREHFMKMAVRGLGHYEFDRTAGFSVAFKRMMRFGEEGRYAFCDCNENWVPDLSKHYSRVNRNIIDWTLELENFLIRMQDEIDKMCDGIIAFFNTDDMASFLDKIKETPIKMIGPASASASVSEG